MVPRQGPMNGIQYRTTTISGFIFFNSLPTLIQLNGFMELIRVWMSRPAGAGTSVN